MARGHRQAWVQRIGLCGLAAGVLAGSARAWAETNAVPQVTAPPSSSPATHALSSFVVEPGFHLELVAEAPQVEAPVALAFDENGRLFVAEMRDFPNHRQETPHLGRIRLLEDTNGSGRYESSTVYADNLPCPSAIACYDGGLFVAAQPDILYLKDSAGTGHADVRRTVFTGFGLPKPPPADAFLNNFNWGLDNRIHAATAGIGGVVITSNSPGLGPVSVAGSDFSFDPRAMTPRAEAGPAQSGLCFDSRGRKFITDYTRPVRLAMFEGPYLARNPFFAHPPEFLELAGPATPIYRFVSQPTVTAAAVSGAGTNPATRLATGHPNILAPAWVSHACGTVVYRGSAFPSNYLDNLFLAEPAEHVIHRAVLHENGLEPTVTRAPGEARTEFVVSQDPAFHPLQLVNGPDGLLYVADFCQGQGSGRIYRIVPEHFKRPRAPHLGTASARELVGELANADGWRRDTAARLLYQHPLLAAVPLLSDMLAYSKLPLARLHALCALEGLGALRDTHLLRALQDADYRVRERAVVFCQAAAHASLLSEALWNQLAARAADPSVCVRYQLALTLGEVPGAARIPVLARILSTSDDRWLRAAVLSSIGAHEAELLVQLANHAQFVNSRNGFELLQELAAMVGVEGKENQVKGLLDFMIKTSPEPALSFPLLAALGEGLHRTRSSLALVDPQSTLQPFYSAAQSATSSRSAPEALRVHAIRLLSVSPYSYADIGDLLLLTLGSGESAAIQAAALAALGRYDDPRIARALLARWPVLPPDLHAQAVTTLLAWTNRISEVLKALEQGQLQRQDLSAPEQSFLRTYPDPEIGSRAARMLGPLPLHRPEVVQRYQSSLRLRGLPSRGRELFRARCANCHQLGGEGFPLGPDLVAFRVSGKEKLLLAVLEPNAYRLPGYELFVLQTKPGELRFGLVRDENLSTLTLRQPNGRTAVWPRANLDSVRRLSASVMPDGLEQGLSTQDIADLLDYVMTQ